MKQTIRIHNGSNGKTKKYINEWYDEECREAKKNAQTVRLQYDNDTRNEELKKIYISMKNEYKGKL